MLLCMLGYTHNGSVDGYVAFISASEICKYTISLIVNAIHIILCNHTYIHTYTHMYIHVYTCR